ncbi:MAG: hypothetical protein Q4B85_08460 [Lachnospiraceae bacterium]|nr:hypothetical protein [Lachnospiraceae bacterium]
MKRKYVTPTAECEVFAANEYVAACWKIFCNVPNGYAFEDLNGNGKYDKRSENIIASGYGCGEWHTGIEKDPSDVPVANAMWQPTFWGSDSGAAYPVYWFSTGSGNNNQHFSKVSDAQWETNPNAS